MAFVTGAGSGIGEGIAIGLAEAGADVALFDLTDSQGLEDTARAIGERGRLAIKLTGTVAEADALTRAAEKTEADLGPLSLAVNCAGIANAAAAEDMPLDQRRKMLEVNLTGVFLSCQAVGRAMLQRGRGAIVNIASMSGSIVNRGLQQAHYNTSKAGVIHLSKSLAMESVGRGGRVDVISTGYTLTSMNKRPEVAEQLKIFAARLGWRASPVSRKWSVRRFFFAEPGRQLCHRRRLAGRWRF
jgi:NAD(P)-dependent dehydrogenase (short-subunit alcohol dehydrogenase family)